MTPAGLFQQLPDIAQERGSSLPVGTAAREQLVLPGMLTRLHTDPTASISVPGADGGEEEHPIYRPLFGPRCATVGELQAALAALWKGVADDQRKAEALTQLLDPLVSGSAGDDFRYPRRCGG